jgi:hypothetical protein
MFCSSCGVALAQHLKYCNRCGAQLATSNEAVVKKAEKRLDEYLDGLFWLTVLGLALIFGGIALMQKLNVGSGFMIAYLVLSSAAFLVNFWLNLREVFRITRSSKEPKGTVRLEQLSTSELSPMNAQAVLDGLPSITENTTRELESLPKKHTRP